VGIFSNKAAESDTYAVQAVLFDEFQHCQGNIFYHIKIGKDHFSISRFVLTNKKVNPNVPLSGLTIFL